MDAKLYIPEEHACDTGRDSYGSIPKVTYRLFQSSDYVELCQLYWEYHLTLTGEDLSKEATLPDGKKYFLVESYVHEHFNKGRKIQLAMDGEKPVGFLIYYPEFNFILVSGAFMMPQYRKRNYFKGLFYSLRPTFAAGIFQTNKVNPPKDLLEHTKHARKLLHEDSGHYTWIVDFKGAQ